MSIYCYVHVRDMNIICYDFIMTIMLYYTCVQACVYYRQSCLHGRGCPCMHGHSDRLVIQRYDLLSMSHLLRIPLHDI